MIKFLNKGKLKVDFRKKPYLQIKDLDASGSITTKIQIFIKRQGDEINIEPIKVFAGAGLEDVVFYPPEMFIEINKSELSEHFFNKLYEIGIENIKYIAQSKSRHTTVFYLPKDDLNIEVITALGAEGEQNFSKAEELKILKAYETPVMGKKKIFLALSLSYIERKLYDVLRTASVRMPETLKEKYRIPKLAEKVHKEGKKLLGEYKQKIEKAKKEKATVKLSVLKSERDFLKKYYDVLISTHEVLTEINNMKTISMDNSVEFKTDINKVIKKINAEIAEPLGRKNIMALSFPVVDFQAGGGDHLKAVSDLGIPTFLLGAEIRKVNGDIPKNNYVGYGVDFNFYKPVFESYNKAEKRLPVYYLNPPYTRDGRIEKDSIDAVPTGSLMVGVFSTKQKKYLQNIISGIIMEVPAKEVGYAEDVVSNVLVVIGRKRALNDFFTPRYRQREKIDMYELTREVDNEIIEKLTHSIERLNAEENKINVINFFEKIKNEAKEFQQITPKIKEKIKEPEVINKILSPATPITQAINGEKIFPDIRFFGQKPLLTFTEVATNIPLLSAYKENYAGIFDFVKKVSEVRDIKIPEIKDKAQKEYLTTKNIGIMRLRYLPKKIEVNDDTMSVLIESIKEILEDKEKLNLYLEDLAVIGEKGKYFTIKSAVSSKNEGGSVMFGSTSILSVVDSAGRDILALQIPLSNFFDKLEEKGILDIKQKYEVIEPDKKIKEKLLAAYISHVDKIKKFLEFDTEKYFNDYIVAAKEKKILRFIADVIKKEDLTKKIKETLFPISSLNADLKSRLSGLLKSTDFNIDKKKFDKFIEKIANIYNEKPSTFVKNRDTLIDRMVEKMLEEKIVNDKEIAKNIAETIMESCAGHYSQVAGLRNASAKLLFEFFDTERMRRIKDIDKKYKIFESLFLKKLQIRPHQYNEAIRFLAKREKTGEKGHLIGWEMRAGKTLAMLSSGYFASLYYNEDTFFFPKSANLNDIIRQGVNFLPTLAFSFVSYETGNIKLALTDERVRKTLSNDLYPNVFALLSQMRVNKKDRNAIIKGKGQTVESLLKTYTKEIENFISILSKNKVENYKDKVNRDKIYSFVLDLKGFSEEVKYALYFYFEKLDRKNILLYETPEQIEQFEKLKESFDRLSDRLFTQKDIKNKRVPKTDFVFHILSKEGQLPVFNYKIELAEKTISFAKNGITSLTFTRDYNTYVNEIPFENLEEVEKEIYNSFSLPEEYNDTYIIGSSLYDRLSPYYEMNNVMLYTTNLDSVEATKLTLKENLTEEEKKEAIEILNENKQFSDLLKPAKNVIGEVLLSSAFGESMANIFGRGTKVVKMLPIEFNSIICNIDKEKKTYQKVEFVVEKINEKDLSKVAYNKKKITAVLEGKGTKDGVSFSGSVKKDNDIKKIVETSSTNKSNYFVHSKFWQEKKPVVIFDEIDESSNPDGKLYKIAKYVMQNSTVRIGGTGTPTSGYPEGVVGLLGLLSDMPIEAVQNSMDVVKRNFSVIETVSKGKKMVGMVFYQALENALLKNEANLFIKDIHSLANISDPKTLLDKAFSVCLNYCGNDSVFLTNAMDYALKETGKVKLGMEMRKLIVNIQREIKKQKGKNFLIASIDANMYKYIAGKTGERLGLLKRTAGTFDPIGFVSSLEGASLSLNTRANLKSESAGKEITEKKEYDYNNIMFYLGCANNALTIDIGEETRRKLETEAEGSKNSSFLAKEIADFADGTQSLRHFYDVDLQEYKKKTNISSIYGFVVENSINIVREIAKKPELLIKSYNLSVSPKELTGLLNKSTTSNKDSVIDIIKLYLVNNYDMSKVQKELRLSNEKIAVAKAVLSEVGSAYENMEKLFLELQSKLKSKTNNKDEETVIYFTTPGGYKTPVVLYSEILESEFPVFYKKSDQSFFYETNDESEIVENKLFFSVEKDFSRRNWEKAGIEPITLTVPVCTGEFDDVLDSISNVGQIFTLRKTISENKNFLVASPRLESYKVAVYDTISTLFEAKEKGIIIDKPVYLLMRAPTLELLNDFKKNIPFEKLEKKGIYVSIFKNNTSLDLESQKHKKNILKNRDSEMLVVASTDGTIARGVDLSHLDEMICFGVNNSGREASQLFARLFNATNKNYAKINVCGSPLKFKKFKEEVKIDVSRHFYRTFGLLSKIDFIDKVMSGDLINQIDNKVSEYSLVKGTSLLEEFKSSIDKSSIDKISETINIIYREAGEDKDKSGYEPKLAY